jgi:hypothetical protein
MQNQNRDKKKKATTTKLPREDEALTCREGVEAGLGFRKSLASLKFAPGLVPGSDFVKIDERLGLRVALAAVVVRLVESESGFLSLRSLRFSASITALLPFFSFFSIC